MYNNVTCDLSKKLRKIEYGTTQMQKAVSYTHLVLLVNKGRVENLTIRQIAIMAAFSLYFGYTSHGVDNAAHVGGLLVGFFAAFLFYRRKKRVIGGEL